MSNGGPSIGLVRTSTSGHAVVELTSSRIDSPPRCVSNRTSPNNNDDTDVVDSRAEGISVSVLKDADSRGCLESSEVLMHTPEPSAERIEPLLQSQGSKPCQQ